MTTEKLPPTSAIDYTAIIDSLPASIKLAKGMKLLNALSDEWFRAYKRQSGRVTNVTDMAANGFVFMFDLEGSDHCDGRGPQPPGMFPRVVAAYGLSQPPEHGRESDDTRMRRWMGPTQEVFGTGWDKGHFIAFSIGGEISGSETNVFSHRRELNRGWSEEGKRFRRFEQFAAEHPGTLFFHRPIYLSESATPDWLEVGVVREDLSLWCEAFDNRLG
jgi:hypothetical protein